MLSDVKPRSPVGEAIGQQRPFRTPRQEGVVALLVAADAVKRVFVDLLARRGEVTLQQYNVLRILRGAGPEGLPTLEIAGRMMERTPGVSRLIDRLEAKGLVRRERGPADRRQVLCSITPGGLRMLADLDTEVDAADERALASLEEGEVARLVELLNRVRAGLA